MYSCLVSKTFDADAYEWFNYRGKSMEVPFRGITRTLAKGQRFGVCRAPGSTKIRLVFDNDLGRVMIIDLAIAKKIARNIQEA